MKTSTKILLALAKVLNIELDEKKLEMVEATLEDGSVIKAPEWAAGHLWRQLEQPRVYGRGDRAVAEFGPGVRKAHA